MHSIPLFGSTIGDPLGDFVIAEWSQEGMVDGKRLLVAPYHIHRHSDEAWYVLEGTLGVQVDDDVIIARAGDAVFAPKGSKHTYWNPGTETAKYLLVMTKKTFQLVQAIHNLSDRSHDHLVALFEQFDSEYLGF
jgi:uncharacterized RmlC-like cupin family protein